MVKVAITCTAPRCDIFVTRLKLHGIDATAIPALDVKILNTPSPEGNFDAILFTSAHAIKSLVPKLPAVAIGAHTAKIATDSGYDVIQMGENNLKSMDLSRFRNILYPCAAQPSYVPDNATPWIIYETQTNPNFSLPLDVGFVAVFSVKGADVVNQIAPKHAKFICLSHAIADELNYLPTDRLAVCAQPDYDEMEKLIIRMCES